MISYFESATGKSLGGRAIAIPGTLTRLHLGSQGGTVPVVPGSFLGGYTPRPQSLLVLDAIPFPELPTLLLSASHLSHLDLWRIPNSGYISPEAMVTCLSALTCLESLAIKFEFPRSSRLDRKSRRLGGRILLSVLTDLHFKGVGEYLDELVAWIDAPLLGNLEITFFHQLSLDTPQLTQFISRTLKFKTYEDATSGLCRMRHSGHASVDIGWKAYVGNHM